MFLLILPVTLFIGFIHELSHCFLCKGKGRRMLYVTESCQTLEHAKRSEIPVRPALNDFAFEFDIKPGIANVI